MNFKIWFELQDLFFGNKERKCHLSMASSNMNYWETQADIHLKHKHWLLIGGHVARANCLTMWPKGEASGSSSSCTKPISAMTPNIMFCFGINWSKYVLNYCFCKVLFIYFLIIVDILLLVDKSIIMRGEFTFEPFYNHIQVFIRKFTFLFV